MPNPLTIIPPVQNRGGAYAGVLSQILSMRQANQQQAAAAAQAEEDQRTSAVKAALTPYAGQPQLMTLALQKLAPEDQQRAQRAGFGIVPPMESPEQVLARTKAKAQTNDITGQQASAPPVQPAAPPPPAAAGQSVVDSAIGNAPDQPQAAPSAAPTGSLAAPPPPTMVSSANAVIDAENRHSLAVYGKELSPEYVKRRYTELLQGPDALVKADQIETKMAPTAQETITNAANDRTFNQVTKPKADAEIANLGSEAKYRDTVQAPNTRATTAHTQAETVKAGAETQKIGEEVKALRQSNDPVVRSTLARSLVDGVLTDPQSFYALPTEDKKLVVGMLRRAPSKLAASEVDQINASENGLNLLRDTRAIVDKWSKRGVAITGPVLGRYEEAANKFGDGIMPPNLSPEQKTEFAQDISKMHEWLTVLPILETKGLVGSRPAKEVISRVATVTPSLSKATDFFDGAMAGTQQRLEERQKTLTAKQWGGKPPVLDGGITGTKQLDETTARQFLQQAGGDKDKARQIAKAAGYTF